MLSAEQTAGQQQLLPWQPAAEDLRKPVERCIQSMYAHADAVDAIASVIEAGMVDGRPLDLAWIVTATAALQTTAALLILERLTERAGGKKPLEVTP
jgi:hypothetical protein